MEFFIRQLLNIWVRTSISPSRCYESIERYGRDLAPSTLFNATLPNGCTVACNLQDHIQRLIYFLGAYEPVEAYLFTLLLKEGMTVIDIGANIGQYSLLAATKVGDRGSVHSFEPVPSTFARLKTNVDDNNLKNIHLNQSALHNEKGTITMSLSEEMLQNLGAYSVGGGNSKNAVEVPTIRLDDYIQEHNISKIDLVKIDIEGSEGSALMGMKFALKKDRPILLIEINRPALEKMNSSPEILWNFLIEELSYQPYLITGNRLESVNDLTKIVQGNFLMIDRETNLDLNTEWNYKKVLKWSRQKK
jgi:FkbM family methyltransferase